MSNVEFPKRLSTLNTCFCSFCSGAFFHVHTNTSFTDHRCLFHVTILSFLVIYICTNTVSNACWHWTEDSNWENRFLSLASLVHRCNVVTLMSIVLPTCRSAIGWLGIGYIRCLMACDKNTMPRWDINSKIFLLINKSDSITDSTKYLKVKNIVGNRKLKSQDKTARERETESDRDRDRDRETERERERDRERARARGCIQPILTSN